MPVIRISSPALSRGRSVALGDEIDRFGRAADEDDSRGRAALRNRATRCAGGLVRARAPLAQVMDAAMDVGVVGA